MTVFSAVLRLGFQRVIVATEFINYSKQSFLEELIVKFERSLPYSQEPATDPCPEPGEPSPHPTSVRSDSNK
jgi:hypothetical protein